ncbi:MAG: HAD-IB family phosphatase [Chloroflexi bacterium]|nr:HAD-IB family phosphatase [Chloroflexota bacterium]
MPDSRWSRYNLVFFDCDSTLSSIEGIDELARLKGKAGRVGLLTSKAMDGELDLAEVYGKRLRAIKPTRAQLKAVEERYWETKIEDAQAVIAALTALDNHVFIISGGLIDAVKGFGRRLGVEPENIRAVELEYNELSGRWWDYSEPQAQQSKSYLDYSEGPLTVSNGKADIIRELAGARPGRRMMVGDGSSDLAARCEVDLFVGFGGVVARERVKEGADVFVLSASLAPILPLAAGRSGWERLRGTAHESAFRKGLALSLGEERLLFQSGHLRDRFIREFEDVTQAWNSKP